MLPANQRLMMNFRLALSSLFLGILTLFMVWALQWVLESRKEITFDMPGDVTNLQMGGDLWLIAPADAATAFIMALRRWPTLLALAGMIVAACVVLSIALGDVLSQAIALGRVRQLRERHVVTFNSAYYPRRAIDKISIGEDTIHLLIEMIDRQEAYTAIVGNLGFDDPNFAGGHTAIALFGDVVLDLFPELKPDEPTPLPFAVRGAKLADQNIDSLSFAGETIPVVKTLPAGAIFFDVNAGVIPLDRLIVILAPAGMLPLLGQRMGKPIPWLHGSTSWSAPAAPGSPSAHGEHSTEMIYHLVVDITHPSIRNGDIWSRAFCVALPR